MTADVRRQPDRERVEGPARSEVPDFQEDYFASKTIEFAHGDLKMISWLAVIAVDSVNRGCSRICLVSDKNQQVHKAKISLPHHRQLPKYPPLCWLAALQASPPVFTGKVLLLRCQRRIKTPLGKNLAVRADGRESSSVFRSSGAEDAVVAVWEVSLVR